MANRDKISDLMKRAAPYLTRMSDDVASDTVAKEIDALILALETHKNSTDHDSNAHIWTALNRFLQTVEVNGVLPVVGDTSDIGSATQPFRKGFFSELSTLLFKKENVLVMDGSLVLTKQSGKFEENVLPEDTEINFGQILTPGDFLLLRAENKMEYMQVGSLVSGTTYNVTRNLDGSGANDWPAGSVYFVRGHTGDGWLELTANSEQRISVFLQGNAWNQSTEVARIGKLDGWQTSGLEGYGLALGNQSLNETMTFADKTNKLKLSGEVNANSGSLNELDVIGTVEIGPGGDIQIGDVASSNIRLMSDKIIGDLGGSGNVQFILGNLNGYYGMSTDTWGLGVGLADLSQSYIKFANNNLLIKASLESGNTTIDGTGITVLTDPAAGDGYTTILEYGDDSETITAVLEGATDTEEVRHRLRANGGQRAATQTIVSESSVWSRVKLLASKLLMPTKQAIIELFSSGAESKISLTAEKVEVLADTVELKGGKVIQIAEPLGIPQANSMGKIDPSWLPIEEEPTGTFEIPGGAMVLWAGALAPTGFAFVTELDNQFVMGHTSTVLGTSLGSTTHSHTNPTAANGGGHSNHVMNISGSSIEYGAPAYAFPDKAWIVGQHSHPSGTGSYQSIAGNHGHTYPNTGTASNLPPYYRGLRWIRATANKVAPIGTIVMESAGADLGPDWAICDGTNGTPNLSDKFIYAAGSGTGGAKTHTHTTSGNSSSAGEHYHTIQVDSSTTDYTGSSEAGNPTASNRHSHRKVGAQSTNAGAHTHTVGTSGDGSTLPPYIVVRYWQRISTSNEASFPSGVVLGTYASSVPLGYKVADTFYGYMPKGVYGAEIVGSRVGTAYGTNHNHIAGAISTAAAHSHGETAAITYDNAGGAQRAAASGSGTTQVGTHNHTFTFNLGAAGAHTHTPDSQYTGSASALPPYKQVMFIIKDIPAPSDSLTVGGDLNVGGNATITGDLKDGSGIAYLKSTEKASDSDKLDGLDSTDFVRDIAYKVSAYRNNTAFTLTTSGTLYAIPLNAEEFDSHSQHDDSTNPERFTCVKAGTYLVTGQVTFTANATGNRDALLRVNGSNYIGQTRYMAMASSSTSVPVFAVVGLAVNDYVELIGRQYSGGSLTLYYANSLSNHLKMVRLGS